MLATVLKSARATQATLAIIETYAQVRSMVRDMEAIQTEKAVRDMLLAEPWGRIVQILPSAMPHEYKVGSMWLGAIRERRAAIIARGNSEIEFSRAACLEVNEAAAELAAQALPAGQRQGVPCGKAVYWLPEGPKVVS